MPITKYLQKYTLLTSLFLTGCLHPLTELRNSGRLEQLIAQSEQKALATKEVQKSEPTTSKRFSLKTLSKRNDLYPDKIKIGIMFPLFADLGNFDNEVERTNRLVSIVASDISLESPKDNAREGGIYIPQIELDYFLSEKEDFSFFWRVGVNYDNSLGTERIHLNLPIPAEIDIDIQTKIGVVTTACGLDYSPSCLRNENFNVFMGIGLEGHYFWMHQESTPEFLNIPLFTIEEEKKGFGLTTFARVGAELNVWDPMKIIPNDISVSAVAEYHQTITSILGDDPDGCRFMFYIIKPIPIK